MKKFISLLLTLTMVVGLVVTASASQTIKVEKAGSSSVSVKEDSEIISYIKTQLMSHSFDSDKETEAVIRQGLKDCKVSMSESEIRKAVKLMSKLRSMGVEPKDIVDQVDSIYAKNKKAIDNGTFSLEDIGIEDLNTDKLVKKTISIAAKSVVKKIGNSIKNLFKK